MKGDYITVNSLLLSGTEHGLLNLNMDSLANASSNRDLRIGGPDVH
mgnify:CR=1 FL=1